MRARLSRRTEPLANARARLSLLCCALLASPACGARSELRALDGAVVDAPARTDARDAPIGPDVAPRVTVVCPAPVRSRQTDTAALHASASSNVGLPLRYAWTVERAPVGSTSQPAPADAPDARFAFDAGGEWLLRFTATDTLGNSDSCTVSATADPAIAILCPDDQSDYQSATVALRATAASTLGRAVRVRWTTDARPAGSVTQPAPLDALNASLLLDQLGDWTLRLTATDDAGLSASCVTHVHADPDVLVRCPPDVSSRPFAAIDLTGEASSRLGRPLTYLWEIVAQPVTSTAVITAPTARAASFRFDVAGDWTYRFTARNDRGNAASCTTRALARSEEAVRVELVWNLDRSCAGCNAQGGGLDLDLHVTDAARAQGHWNDRAPGDSDCYWANCHCGMPGSLCAMGALDWPPSGALDDPQLDVDHMSDLPGPENINVLRAALGATFDVGVHFFGDNTVPLGRQSTRAVVRVYCGGGVAFESEPVAIGPARTASVPGEAPNENPLWRVGQITITPAGCTFARCGAPGAVDACIRPASAW